MWWSLGRGGGQVVSIQAFYSDNPSLNPAEVYSFFVKFGFEKIENKGRFLKSRCGTFGLKVASDTRGYGFEASH